jgi:hypothetical protein
MSSFARDMTNREILKKALLTPKSLHYAVALKLNAGSSTHGIYQEKLEKERLKQLKADEEQRTMAPSVMVPWVRWPGHSETGGILYGSCD